MIRLTDTISEYSRHDWRALTAHPMETQKTSRIHEAFLHHSDDANAARFDTLEEQKAKMRQIQEFHMGGRGWSDIAYHYVIFQPGKADVARIFAGRRLSAVPAAQEEHNTNTLAICVVGDFTPGHDTLDRNTRYAIEVLLRRYPQLKTLGGHRQVVSTSCPGANIMRYLPRIADAVDLRVYKP